MLCVSNIFLDIESSWCMGSTSVTLPVIDYQCKTGWGSIGIAVAEAGGKKQTYANRVE